MTLDSGLHHFSNKSLCCGKAHAMSTHIKQNRATALIELIGKPNMIDSQVICSRGQKLPMYTSWRHHVGGSKWWRGAEASFHTIQGQKGQSLISMARSLLDILGPFHEQAAPIPVPSIQMTNCLSNQGVSETSKMRTSTSTRSWRCKHQRNCMGNLPCPHHHHFP